MIPEKSNFCLSFSQYQLIYFLVFLFYFFYFETNHVNEKNVIIVRRSLGLMMINLSQWIQTGTEILYATFSVISNHFIAIYDNISNNSFSSGYKTTPFFEKLIQNIICLVQDGGCISIMVDPFHQILRWCSDMCLFFFFKE